MQTRLFLGLLGLFLVSCVPESEQTTPAVGEWHHAGGSHFSDKYSPLDQINSSNFSELEISWRWQSIDVNLPRSIAYATGDYRAVPLLVNGVMSLILTMARSWHWIRAPVSSFGVSIQRVML